MYKEKFNRGGAIFILKLFLFGAGGNLSMNGQYIH